jgi:outer membrane receptor protein involved in Fe transport
MGRVFTSLRAQFPRALLAKALVFVSLVGGVPTASYAQHAQLHDLSLEELLAVQIDSSSKTSKKQLDAPASVSVITRDEIKRLGFRTLGEAVSSLAGIYLSSDRNYDYVGIRGLSRPGDYNTRIIVSVNGNRLNDPNFDCTPMDLVFPLDLWDVERIEISRGPISVAGGTNALFGVINVISRKGDTIKGSEAHIGLGTHNALKGSVRTGDITSEGLTYSASITSYSSQGEGAIYFPAFDQPDTNNGRSVGRDDEEAYKAHLLMSKDDLSFFLASSMRNKEIPTASFGSSFNRDIEATRDRMFIVDLSYRPTIDETNSTALLLRTFANRAYYRGRYPSATETGDPFLSKDGSNTMQYGVETNISSAPSKSFSYVVGGEARTARDLRLYSFAAAPEYASYLDRNDTLNVYSLYAESTWKVSPFLDIVPGVRYDYFSFDESATSPRLAFIGTLPDDSTLKLIYGSAFRAPNNYERNYETVALGYRSNPGLNSEKLNSFELVYAKKLSEHFIGTLGAYRYSIDDIISQTTVDEELIFQNGSAIEGRGIESELQGVFENGLSVRASYSFQEAIDTATNLRTTNAPQHLARLGISIPLFNDLITASPYVTYMSSRRLLSGDTLDSVAQTNVTLFSDTLVQNFEFRASAYNLFNERTGSPAAEEHVQDRIPSDGRTFFFEVVAKL